MLHSFFSQVLQRSPKTAVYGIWPVPGVVRGTSTTTKQPLLQECSDKPRRRCRPWTQQEDDLLVDLRLSGHHWNEAAAKLPGRSVGSCVERGRRALADRLGDSRRLYKVWSAEEDAIIARLRQEGYSWLRIADELPQSRNPAAVYVRWSKLQRPEKAPQLKVPFTKEEDARLCRLRENEDLSWLEITKQFPGRSCGSLKNRYTAIIPPAKRVWKRRAQSKLTESHMDQVAKLREAGLSWRAIAERLDVDISPAAIAYKYAHLRSKNPGSRKYRRFSEEEDNLIRQLRAAGMGWQLMSRYIPGRGANTLQYRFELIKRRPKN
ncbi:hypothetical protein M433DRAFT_148572 [Acidomyces richmondensis BFW]|nr:MAG: hypothetical protein FE78DRAFT_86999 [Acidomyces sp. 'richmondensis']KYG50644.1 hypothetical protein M433DRAFT_148572 [Acidomyces richmondensis BFW]